MERADKRNLRTFSPYFTPRYLLGLILIISSFISAYVISKASDRTITVWSSTVDLAPGEVIKSSDITLVRVRLPENAAQYLDGSARIEGASVVRSIGAAELIPSFAISSKIDETLVQVPISVPRELTPIEISGGAVVDIYGLPNRNNQMLQADVARTKLIMSGITIDSVDDSTRELGGRVGVTLLVPNDLVLRLVTAMSDYELLLVRRTLQF